MKVFSWVLLGCKKAVFRKGILCNMKCKAEIRLVNCSIFCVVIIYHFCVIAGYKCYLGQGCFINGN